MPDKKKILIIDDDPDVLETMGAVLETREYKVLTALSGLEGIRKAEEEKPDLIMLDVTMPEIDGFSVCKIIKENDDLKSIPVILLTGKATEEDVKKGTEAGASDYVVKPIDWDNLFLKIEKLVT